MSEPSQDEADAFRDDLTGLPSVEAVHARLGEWLAQAAATGEAARIHAMLLGLRRFNTVNLAHGAAAGDGALAEVSVRISHFAASELDCPWLVARGSGGNFLLVADEACSRERWQFFAEQLADRIALPIAVPAGVLRLSPRIALLRGLAEEGVDSMLDRLGHALDVAERGQGRRLAWADGETVKPGHSSAQLDADLLRAIDRDEIEIVFQPQFGLPDDRLTGAEALARWNHARLGRIGAGALFAIAERADHVEPLSRHIARRAMTAMAGLPAQLRLSLNVTPADLAKGSYAGELMGIVEESRFPPERLTLEITEQALLQDVHLAARTASELTAQGIRIALDDFGAGFCNFRYLKLLPLHYLKLDRSMIDGITSDPRDLAVLRAIIAMAGALDLQVIAEGIETEEQRDLIAREGCAYYQGFLRAAPMSAAEFATMAGT
jgi:EAL domain-containing protein (putative c-di-GMP-specific phosphodiesterase class I)/GGDEF domain-containing protein